MCVGVAEQNLRSYKRKIREILRLSILTVIVYVSLSTYRHCFIFVLFIFKSHSLFSLNYFTALKVYIFLLFLLFIFFAFFLHLNFHQIINF